MSLRTQLSIDYNNFSLQVDLNLPSRGIIGIFGHSGSGKTTLLRCIAGLEQADGEVSLNDEVWQSKNHFLPPHKRSLGYVFQEASLFPHLTVEGNLNYARKRALPSINNSYTFDDTVELFNINNLLARPVQQLSGGEKQRVAIVRALLINPRLLLMDEPLASLDATHKQEILPYLEQLHRKLAIPVLYVSHSADEITRLADQLVILKQGAVVANGPLQSTLARLDLPVKLGEDTGVVIDATVAERDKQWHLVRVVFNGGEMWLRDDSDGIGQTVRVRILARDVSLALQQHEDSSILNRLHTEIMEIKDDQDPAMALTRLKSGNETIIARITKRSLHHLQLVVGMSVWAQIKSVAIVR